MNTPETPDQEKLGLLILQYYVAGSPKLLFEALEEDDPAALREYKALDEAYSDKIKKYIDNNFETRVAQDFLSA